MNVLETSRPMCVANLCSALCEVQQVERFGTDGELLVALHRFGNQVAALFSQKVARFDREQGYTADAAVTTSSWLRHLCHLTNSEASNQVQTARRLEDLPVARDSFERGEISFAHASAVARTVAELGNLPNPDYRGEPDEGRNVEESLVKIAERFNPAQLWQACKSLNAVLDPDGSLSDADRERRAQYLAASRTVDGMMHLQGLLAPESAEIVETALNAAMGPRSRDDDRSARERRADALVDLAMRVLNQGELPTHDAERPHVQLIVDYTTLRGEPGDAAILGASGQPVPGETARRIACDCILTPIVVGEDGDVLRVGRRHRLFSARQSVAMALRDGHCVFPGCDRDVRWCENHHLDHWAAGGETNVERGAKVCGFHHRLVHEGGWFLWRDESGEWQAAPCDARPRRHGGRLWAPLGGVAEHPRRPDSVPQARGKRRRSDAGRKCL